ncbi:unnamed protein product [Vicia faba]|uniref:Uncharacterized protein n=1 Tax=Vicia faba TaxID=3906 RepID=A0AAV0ZDL7_VICFA|nr:unnamed protein product [Vicia faba]
MSRPMRTILEAGAEVSYDSEVEAEFETTQTIPYDQNFLRTQVNLNTPLEPELNVDKLMLQFDYEENDCLCSLTRSFTHYVNLAESDAIWIDFRRWINSRFWQLKEICFETTQKNSMKNYLALWGLFWSCLNQNFLMHQKLILPWLPMNKRFRRKLLLLLNNKSFLSLRLKLLLKPRSLLNLIPCL